MHFITALAAAAALATGAHALVIPRATHVSDFRLFGASGCVSDNLGIFTVLDDQFKNGECKSFNGDVPKALLLGDINQGCTLRAYTDEHCHQGAQVLKVKTCLNAKSEFKGWTMTCSSKN